MASEHHCCFCAKLLFDGLNKKKLDITIHHLVGSVQTDNREKAAPIEQQLFAHSACHRAYHQLERLLERGKNIDQERFKTMEENIRRTVNFIKIQQFAHA